MGHEDGEADSDASLTAVHGRLWIASRLENHEDQQEGAHHLANHSVPPMPLRTHTVRPQAFSHVQLRRKDGTQDGGAANRAHHLGAKVENSLHQPTVAREYQAQGHSAIHLAAAVVSDGVSQGRDGQAKHQGHHENPTRNHGGRLSRSALFVAATATCAAGTLDTHRTATTDYHKQGHADKLSHACDKGDIFEEFHLFVLPGM